MSDKTIKLVALQGIGHEDQFYKPGDVLEVEATLAAQLLRQPGCVRRWTSQTMENTRAALKKKATVSDAPQAKKTKTKKTDPKD